MIVSGIFWSAAYILIIRRGFKDKTFGIPLIALCANISWETIFAFITPHDAPQLYTNYVWFSLDVIIVFQFLRYGRAEFLGLSKIVFYCMFILGIAVASSAILSVNAEFGDTDGVYAAFGQNLMMSVLFVWMLYTRGDLRGQSIYIGLFKLLGTAAASLAFYQYRPIAAESILLQYFFVLILVFDVIYLSMLIAKSRSLDLSLKRI